MNTLSIRHHCNLTAATSCNDNCIMYAEHQPVALTAVATMESYIKHFRYHTVWRTTTTATMESYIKHFRYHTVWRTTTTATMADFLLTKWTFSNTVLYWHSNNTSYICCTLIKMQYCSLFYFMWQIQQIFEVSTMWNFKIAILLYKDKSWILITHSKNALLYMLWTCPELSNGALSTVI